MNLPVVHPDDDELTELLKENLDEDVLQRVESHLAQCESCQQRLTELSCDQPWWDAASSYLGIEDAPLDAAGEGVDLREVRGIVAPSDDPRMIGRIGNYEIAGVIGSGATGIVVKALDPALNRFVAIKLLRPSLAVSPAARMRFEREGRAAASIVHENVIAVHGVSDWNGVPYLVMPYIPGESLATRIARGGPLRLDEMLRIGWQVASGLAAAHEQGIIHRDVKPANILLETGVERLKLTDFGLARVSGDTGLTLSGMLAGTPEYMSPEQAMSEELDSQSDLFSLGSVLWTMTTGRPPFVGESCYAVIRKIVDCNPSPMRNFDPRVPLWWQELVSTLMRKSPEDRLGSASRVAETLRACLAHVQDPANPLPPEVSQREVDRRKNLRRPLVAACVLTLVGSLLVLLIIDPPRWASPLKLPPKEVVSPADPQNAISSQDPDPLLWDDGTEKSLNSVDDILRDLNNNH